MGLPTQKGSKIENRNIPKYLKLFVPGNIPRKNSSPVLNLADRCALTARSRKTGEAIISPKTADPINISAVYNFVPALP